MINYAQIVSVMTTFELNMPRGMVNGFDFMGNPIKEIGFSIECYLTLTSASSTSLSCLFSDSSSSLTKVSLPTLS